MLLGCLVLIERVKLLRQGGHLAALQGTVVAVPEPGTWLLMAGGLLLLARRKQVVCRQAAAQRLAA